MRLGILADTHDQLDRTRTAVELLRAAKVAVLDLASGELTSLTVPD